MLHSLIKQKKTNWLSTQDCPVRSVIEYIHQKGELRDAQIEAIETWLFLKIAGENKPLWQLFSEGFFNSDIDLSKLHISQNARDALSTNRALQGLFEFARQKNGNAKSLLPELEKHIIENPAEVGALPVSCTLSVLQDCEAVQQDIAEFSQTAPCGDIWTPIQYDTCNPISCDINFVRRPLKPPFRVL